MRLLHRPRSAKHYLQMLCDLQKPGLFKRLYVQPDTTPVNSIRSLQTGVGFHVAAVRRLVEPVILGNGHMLVRLH